MDTVRYKYIEFIYIFLLLKDKIFQTLWLINNLLLQKEYFIGKFALQHQKEQDVLKMWLILFIVNELDINNNYNNI